MVHKLSLVFSLVLLILIFLISGCAQSINEKENEIPDPYKLALIDIKIQNYDSGYRYLELTINDFPNSNYVNNAYLLKSIIDRNRIYNNIVIMENLIYGMDNGLVFYKDNQNSEEFKRWKNFIEELKNQIDDSKKRLLDDIAFINTIDGDTLFLFNDFTIDQLNHDTSEPFAFFKKIGTPVPTDNEYDSEKQRYEKLLITISINEIIKDNQVDLTKYYFDLLTVAISLGLDNNVIIQLADKILQLTENDKYNRMRLDTEDYIMKYNLDKPNKQMGYSEKSLTESDAVKILNELKVAGNGYTKLVLLNYNEISSDAIPDKENYYVYQLIDTRYDTGSESVYCVNKYDGKVCKWLPDGRNTLIN